MMNIKNNVILITLDCCSYKTASKAKIPFLRSISDVYKAEAYGTYTLPSHISTFAGYFPKRVYYETGNDYFCRNGHQFWRLKSARAKDNNLVDLFLEGDTIIEGYRKLGFYTMGIGGVRWFKNTLLTSYFDDFIFVSGNDYEDVFKERKKGDFALDNGNLVLEKLKNKEKWFLFMNSHETHVPYDTGKTQNSIDEWRILNKARPLWGGKINNMDVNLLNASEFEVLQQMQIRALEDVDKKLKLFFGILPKPFTVVIMGDHGEDFGEDGLYGHGFPHPSVIEVPLIFGEIE